MKALLSAALTLVSMAANANAGSVNVRLDASRPVQNATVNSEETHTIYEDRMVDHTCYRDVLVRVDHVCRHADPVCRNERTCRHADPVCTGEGANRVCHPSDEVVCKDEVKCHPSDQVICEDRPIYVSEAYSCPRLERVAVGEKTDFIVQGRAEIRVVGNLPAGTSLSNEVIQLDLNGESLTVRDIAAAKDLLLLVRKNVSVQVLQEETASDAGLKQVDAVIELTPISAREALSAISGGIRDLRPSRDHVSATLGRVELANLLVLQLKIEKAKIFNDKVLINRELSPNEITLIDRGSTTELSIDLRKLGLNLEKGKHNVEITARIKTQDGTEILNAGAFGDRLKASAKKTSKL